MYPSVESIKRNISENMNLHIFIKLLTGRTTSISVCDSTTILELKILMEEKEGISIGNTIIFAGKQLEDYRTFRDYNIQTESTLHYVLRLRGGLLR